MRFALFFLVVAACLLAPHLARGDAIVFAWVCIALAVVFGISEAPR